MLKTSISKRVCYSSNRLIVKRSAEERLPLAAKIPIIRRIGSLIWELNTTERAVC